MNREMTKTPKTSPPLRNFLTVLGFCTLVPWLGAREIAFDQGSGRIIEGTTSPDGEFAVVVTADLEKNVVVFLPEKRQVLDISGAGIDERSFPYFPDLNHASLRVQWGPDQEGSRLALLFYETKWESAGVVLVEVDGGFGSQASIGPMLQKAAIAAAGDELLYSFSPGGLDLPKGDLVLADPVDVKIDYLGQSPGDIRFGDDGDEDTSREGIFAVSLARGPDGPVVKSIDGVEQTPVASEGVARMSTAGDFREFRTRMDEKIDADVESGAVEKVKLHWDAESGRRISYLGYLDTENEFLRQLVWVNSADDDNETYVIYYWKDGLVASAFEVKKGSDAEADSGGRTTTIYNFEYDRLVGVEKNGEEIELDESVAAETAHTIQMEAQDSAMDIYNKIDGYDEQAESTQ